MAYSRPAPLRATVIRMVNLTTGVATDEVQGMTVRQVGRVMEKLMADGQAFAAKLSAKSVRYFATRELADLYVEARQFAASTRIAEKARTAFAPRLPDDVASWSHDAEPHFPVDADGVPTWLFTPCAPSPIGLHRTNTHAETH